MKGLSREERKQLKADIVEYRKQGHYLRECCEHFNVKPSYVYMACKGIDYPWKYDTETMSKAAKEQNKDVHANPETAVKHINASAPWCEYVDGYTTWSCYVNVRCKTCGKISNLSFCWLRQGRSKCPECEKVERIAKREAKQRAERIEAHEIKRIKKIRKAKHKQIQFKVCACCGSLFVPTSTLQTFCSDKCRARAKDQRHGVVRRTRIKNAITDKHITLEALYRRDGGVCCICGGMCDWNDYHYTDETFVADNYYPSIDHIKPLSKGGKHSWSNIQLAHKICNSLKGNRILPLGQKTA